MTKKRILLSAFAFGALLTLFAFTNPNQLEHTAFNAFFIENFIEPFGGGGFVVDTVPPYEERYDDFMTKPNPNPVDLKDPKAVEQKVEYDPESGLYIISEKIGEEYYRAPTYMTFEEYLKWKEKKQRDDYFDRLQGVSDGSKKNVGADPIAKFDVKPSLVERLFGSTNVDIKPQGNINLTFGYNYQKIENPVLTLRQQRNGIFDFDMDINMSAQGKIGEKLNLNFNYNTQATFDFDNQMKLAYDPKSFSEDEIVQNIEAGNVSLPLRSNLIKGVQNLFGVKTELKFGHLRATLLAAQQRSRQQQLTLQGGSQIQRIRKPIDEYDENRHFLISHWHRREFEPAMSCLPVPQSLFNITKIQVWLTTRGNIGFGGGQAGGNTQTGTRNIVAIADLGEPVPYRNEFQLPFIPADRQDIKGNGLPSNLNNDIYPQLQQIFRTDSSARNNDRIVSVLRSELGLNLISDFEKVQAYQLSPSEFTFHEQLGFISINVNVQPDQVVGVALEYTYNGIPFKIGEFAEEVVNNKQDQSTDPNNPVDTSTVVNQNVVVVKMLKSTTANVKLPIWDLMMKNVYSVGAANVDPQNFRFDVVYEDPGKGQKRFLTGDLIPDQLEARPLLQLFNLDNLNIQGDPGPDGIFDFVPGLTVNLRSGRVMFPVLEPFGKFLYDKIKLADPNADTATLNKKLIYNQLYDSTLFRAREFQELNRFTLIGEYKSANSSEISLGTFNLPRNSVRVTAGGRLLQEGVDYRIDYGIGKITILNDQYIQAGQSINVSFEDNTLFGFQNRSMLGGRLDYEFSKDLNVGVTALNLFERPLTQKVNFGDDPINNWVFGADLNLTKDAPWMTKFLDKLPLISTKEPSSISAQAEVALLEPGYARVINQGIDKGGVVYIDDFEGSTNGYRLDVPFNRWIISSVPQGDSLFPESNAIDPGLALGANRSRLAWYIAEPAARGSNDGNNPYTLQFNRQEIFPNRQFAPNERFDLPSFDITIFPRERGPYNFELPDGYPGFSRGMTTAGELVEPRTRWAGVMQGLNTIDFELNNIEFVEFWMLNPYMDTGQFPVSESGEMYIDLGNVSEDILRDSKQFFENALPTGTTNVATVNTRWGRVPAIQPLINAFENDPARRAEQDLGLDGLSDEGERELFKDWLAAIMASGLSPNAKTQFESDPSADDYVHFGDNRYGEPQNNQTDLINRYRYFNNQQGNTPINTNGQNNTFLNDVATNIPDMEDLNRDNTLNESESYFRYRIPLKKNASNELDLTDPYLKEVVTETVIVPREINGVATDIKWYRFKVPLDWVKRQSVGGIQDFRSIRFMRMLWRGFSEQTTFRFATLELGRNQWRRYLQALPRQNSPFGVCDVGFDRNVPFDVNAVNIEENASRQPFNYTIPHGISRENSVGAFPDILQNEQALSMNVCDLAPCDARAVFRTLGMDLRQFERIKMFVHAEDRFQGSQRSTQMNKDSIVVFMRIGSDFVSNYYEYEIPLHPSDVNNLNGNPDSREYKEEVWRPENIFDFPLDLCTEVKTQRNKSGLSVEKEFEILDPANQQNKIKIAGNPNLGIAKGVMVGVRNISNQSFYCTEVWLNELRLTGFNDEGGWAGQARVDMKLADIGNVSAAVNYSSINYGGIDQKVLQRQREEVIQLDVSTSLELSKLLPEKSGVRLPFYTSYSKTIRNPEFDPYDLDIKLKDKIRNESDPIKRDEIRTLAQDVTEARAFNFTNVRIDRRGKKKPMPWSLGNFSFTYAQNKAVRRTPFIANDELNQYKGAIDYQYAPNFKPIEPFKKSKINEKYFKFIKELNLSPIPNAFGFSTNMERISGITTYRFAGEDPLLNTYWNRRLTWDRNYTLDWGLMKNLRINFDANARSIVDEPLEFDNAGNRVTTEQRRDSIWNNIGRLGRPKNYAQNVGINYTLPTKQFPLLDFMNIKATYNSGYNWTAQSLKLQNLDAGQYQEVNNSRNLGHTIQNNSTRQINGDFNFETLYNKSKYLAKINKPGKKVGPGSKLPGGPGAPGERDAGPGGAAGKPGGLGDLKSGGGRDRNAGRDSKNDPSKPADPSKPGDPAAGGGRAGAPGGAPGAVGSTDDKGKDGKDGKDDKDKAKSKDKKKDRQPSMAERIALRPLMLVRRARMNYSENLSTVVPGFTPEPKLMGLSEGFAAPGWGFVVGMQPGSEWLDEAASKGWVTYRPELNQQVMRNYSQTLDASVTLEPFNDFRVELTAKRQYTRNSTELFKDQNFNLDPTQQQFEHRAQRDFGSFTTTFFSLNTLYKSNTTYLNQLFGTFENYRVAISNRLGVEAGNTAPHTTDEGYVYGYGRIQQQVLLPAFLAAYTDKDPNKVDLNVFNTRPAINWKLNYNGLSKLGNLKNIFSSVQITHGYSNTLTVSSFNTDIFYNANKPTQVDELSYNYFSRFEIPQVMINEQFQPLLGIDMKLKNDMTMRIDFKKSRQLAMSFIDYNLNETRTNAYTVGFGYRLKNVNIPFLTGKKAGKAGSKSKRTPSKKKKAPTTPGTTPGAPGATTPTSNDLNIKFDFDLRDDVTITHRMDLPEDAIPTRGARTISINPQADYVINRRLTLRLFANYNKTVPKTSQSFPITTLQTGVTVQFKLN